MKYKFPYVTPAALIPSLQCAREYCGLVLGLCLLKYVNETLGIQFNKFHWISDNDAALIWADKNKCASSAAQFTLLFVTWFQIKNKLRLTSSHRAGIQMGDIDRLSRDLPHSLPPALEIHPSIPDLNELFTNCSLLQQCSLEDHHVVMKRVIHDVERFSY